LVLTKIVKSKKYSYLLGYYSLRCVTVRPDTPCLFQGVCWPASDSENVECSNQESGMKWGSVWI